MLNSTDSATRPVALVTGASRGLGKEVAMQLARKGFHVWLGVRDVANAGALLEEVQQSGGTADLVALDINSQDHIAAVVETIAAHNGHLDILVNNAAVMLDGGWVGNSTLTATDDMLRKTFDTNFFGTVALTRALWPLLCEATRANVVNVSSRMGSNTLHADPNGPLKGVKPFAYDASKAAINAFTTHLAEIGKPVNVQVNSAYPGWVRTELGTEHADLSVEEGARTIIQLALLPAGSRTGRFEYLGEAVPW